MSRLASLNVQLLGGIHLCPMVNVITMRKQGLVKKTARIYHIIYHSKPSFKTGHRKPIGPLGPSKLRILTAQKDP